MKRMAPYILAILLVVGVYYAWTTYGAGERPKQLPEMTKFMTTRKPLEPAAEWREIDQTAEGFKVRMPREPKPTTAMAVNKTGGSEPVKMLLADSETATTYAVAWADNPPVERVTAQRPDATLDQARDGALRRTATTMIAESRIAPQGYSGREFVARNVGGGYLETRFVLAGKRLYMLIAASPSVNVRHDQEIQKFFNSFTLASSAQAPGAMPAAGGVSN